MRQITPYVRGVIELFPWREDEVSVPRFLCRKRKLTVSLLPLALVPYHRYTLRSMMLALLLFHGIWGEPGATLEDIWSELPPESNVAIYLLRYWLGEVLRGLRCAHEALRRAYDLSGVGTGVGLGGALTELYSYCCAIGIRGPPEGGAAVADLAAGYSQGNGRFLVGRPSQERRRQG
mgnify:CR=1 FL=1